MFPLYVYKCVAGLIKISIFKALSRDGFHYMITNGFVNQGEGSEYLSMIIYINQGDGLEYLSMIIYKN